MKITTMKEAPAKDYQVLLEDPEFKDILRRYYPKWQTYNIEGCTWLCTEVHEQMSVYDLAEVMKYCARRPLIARISVHPDKIGYLLIMIHKSRSSRRLTVKSITPRRTTEGKARQMFSNLQKAIARNGGSLIGGAVAYEAKRFSDALN